MNIEPSSKLNDIIGEYPYLIDFLAAYNPEYKLLNNRVMRATMGRLATLAMIATTGKISVDKMIRDITDEIKHHTQGEVTGAHEKPDKLDRKSLEKLKDVIKDLHNGVEFSEVKKRFDALLVDVNPSRIAEMEEELIREGMPAVEIQRLCDLHVTVFKDSLETTEPVSAPNGHPVHSYMEENRIFTDIIGESNTLTSKLIDNPSVARFRELKHDYLDVLSKLAHIETHYLRKENQLFPFLEKHSISGPSQVMWGIHDEIRAMLKEFKSAVASDSADKVIDVEPKLSRAIIEMIYKENTILYPMTLDAFDDAEWIEIFEGDSAIGYAFITPGREWIARLSVANNEYESDNSLERLNLDTGSLTLEQANLMLKHLPVEVSFVDENDELRYYSDSPERVFPRSPGVIGRKVQNCHPPKSVDTVKRILQSFRDGTKDKAVFWIRLGEKFILISYFAVRDKEGNYIGTTEVTQDITDIHGLEGEQRLLDWDSDWKSQT